MKTPIHKFEYKVVTGDGPLLKDQFKEDLLNSWGVLGWELVKEVAYPLPFFWNQSYWIFKREIQ
jgi:hypothetical protein